MVIYHIYEGESLSQEPASWEQQSRLHVFDQRIWLGMEMVIQCYFLWSSCYLWSNHGDHSPRQGQWIWWDNRWYHDVCRILTVLDWNISWLFQLILWVILRLCQSLCGSIRKWMCNCRCSKSIIICQNSGGWNFRKCPWLVRSYRGNHSMQWWQFPEKLIPNSNIINIHEPYLIFIFASNLDQSPL